MTHAVNRPTHGDKYERMLQLADDFDASGSKLRDWAHLGSEILRDDDVVGSAELSPKTWEPAEDEIRAATTGKNGLLSRSLELDADALMVRATVLTYQWIDELQSAATKNLGEVAGRAIGFLAPEVELGGSLISAGLIETDALDRDGVTAYLSELAAENPDLMEHITSGGGGLLESLQLRTLLTANTPRGEDAAAAVAGGLHAAGLSHFAADAGHALRDIGGDLVAADTDTAQAAQGDAVGTTQAEGSAPRSLEELMTALGDVATSVSVQPVAKGRYIAYLPGPISGRGRRVRLVSGDVNSYASEAAEVLAATVEPGASVMLVGAGAGGAAAAALAARVSPTYSVEQIVTAGSPAVGSAVVPDSTRVLSLEDRADPVALLGGLIGADSTNRITVVYDGSSDSSYVAGGRAADRADHADLRAEISRIRQLGYLSAESA